MHEFDPAGTRTGDGTARPWVASALIEHGGPVDDRRRLILQEALALADERGLAAVSMRAVARRLGLTSMALYPYDGSKQAVLDGVVDVLLAELRRTATTDGDWRHRLRTVARAIRALAVAHPGAYPLIVLRPSATGADRSIAELIYVALLQAGVPDAEVPRLGRLISIVALGYGTADAIGRLSTGRTEDDPQLPSHRRLREWLGGPADADAEFEADLDDLIGLASAAARRGRARQAQTRQAGVAPARPNSDLAADEQGHPGEAQRDHQQDTAVEQQHPA